MGLSIHVAGFVLLAFALSPSAMAQTEIVGPSIVKFGDVTLDLRLMHEVEDAYKAGEFVYIGARGELVLPGPKHYPDPFVCATVLKRDGELSITIADKEIFEYARVDTQGNITYPGAAKTKFARDMAPTKWPFRTGDGKSLTQPAAGAVLSKEMANPDDADAGPRGNAGWAVLLLRDRIYQPDQSLPRPRDVVWVIPDTLPAFHVVRVDGGESHEVFRVDADRRIHFGEEFKDITEVERKKSHWPFHATEGGTVVTLPRGKACELRGFLSNKYRHIYEDGLCKSSTVPHPVELEIGDN